MPHNSIYNWALGHLQCEFLFNNAVNVLLIFRIVAVLIRNENKLYAVYSNELIGLIPVNLIRTEPKFPMERWNFRELVCISCVLHFVVGIIDC